MITTSRIARQKERICSSHGNSPTATSLARLLRDHFRADRCLLVLVDASSGGRQVYQTSLPNRSRRVDLEALAALSIDLGPQAVLIDRNTSFGETASSAVSTLFPERALLSVSIGPSHKSLGRIFVASNRECYGQQDLARCLSAANQAAQILEELQELEQGLSQAADRERRRVSRDLHDSTIQPYIGLKLGLEALRRKVANLDEVRVEVEELLRMAEEGIADLRGYMGVLSEYGKRRRNHEPLIPALRRLVENFVERHGIQAHVIADCEITLAGDMHSEVMHIVREALSNIRRHTAAKHAAIRTRVERDNLVLEFVNDSARVPEKSFTPRSIGERARELGGSVAVRHVLDYTTVAVKLPL